MSISNKRPELIKYYKPPPADEESGGDFFQLLSFITGFISIMFRYKWGIWISLFLMLSSFFNMKNRGDYKQIMLNFMIIVMGLVTSYFWNIQPPKRPEEPPVAPPVEQQ